MRAVPVVDSVLAVDVARDRHNRYDKETVRGQEVSERKADEAVLVELVSVERQHDHDGDERQKARQHLPFGVPPVRFSFLAFNHAAIPFSVNAATAESDLPIAIPGVISSIIAFLAGEDKSCLDNGVWAGAAGIVVAEAPIIMSVCESLSVAG